jgi:hypothetical protein
VVSTEKVGSTSSTTSSAAKTVHEEAKPEEYIETLKSSILEPLLPIVKVILLECPGDNCTCKTSTESRILSAAEAGIVMIGEIDATISKATHRVALLASDCA